MIKNRKELLECLQVEEKLCRDIGYKGRIHALLTSCEIGKINQYLKVLRLDEYFSNKSLENRLYLPCALYYRRKHNNLGLKLGLRIPINTINKGLIIYHIGNIIVHQDARIGEYCQLHGNNCIGNNGKSGDEESKAPVIGKYANIGIGANVIGNVELADNITVAAGAIVCKNCLCNNAVLIGVPAKVK